MSAIRLSFHTALTGYATIARNILNGLANDYNFECHHFAHNFPGCKLPPGVMLEDGLKFNFWIHGSTGQQYYKDLMEPKLKQLQPDVFMILLDTFMLYPWLVEKDFTPARSVFYFPTDGGGGLPLGCESILKKVDAPICMSKFGQRQVKKAHNIDCGYIPHAVDQEIYKPMTPEERKKLRQSWNVDDKFVIGTVARNQGRKFLDRTIKMFRLIADKIPNAILFLHLDANDPAQVFPVVEMIKRLNLENRVLFTGMNYWEGIPYKEMYKVYNLMDVFLLTTSGEGFGIPIIEAMACEVPVLATDYTTTKELVLENKAGLGINLVGTDEIENDSECTNIVTNGTLTGSWMVERGICDIKDGVDKILRLFNNPDERRTFGLNGRRAVLKEYTWDVVIPQWKEVVEKLSAV